MRAKRVAVGTAAALVVAAIAVAAFWFGPFRGDRGNSAAGPTGPDPATVAAKAFAANWQAGTLAKVPFTPGAGDVAGATALATVALHAMEPNPKVTVDRVDTSEGAGDRAVATATVSWKLGPGRDWSYGTSFKLQRSGGKWLVEWTPSVVHPELRPGEILRTERTQGARGHIVAVDGTVLNGGSGSVVIGIRKARTTDTAATASEVARITGVDLGDLTRKLAKAGPDDFVEVTRLDRASYDRIRDQIQPLPGTVFRTEEDGAGVPAGYARGVLGAVGPATEEIAAASHGAIAVGEPTGLSGLQLGQNSALAGTSGLSVLVGPVDGQARTLKTFPGTDGKDVTVTLESKVQTAAQDAVAATGEPSALVAIRASTGEVLAVANGPSNASAYNRAFIGRYPPGSVFKIATTWALLEAGVTPDTVVDCPATITVGKTFKNAGGLALGPVPFRTDFARSCNTAFIGLASKISAKQLADAAALLGYRPLDIGAPMFPASVPVDGNNTEHAAQMIGQGRVEGTVLNVATMSASIASGTAVTPRLLVDPAAPRPTPGAQLPAERIATMRELMRAVVTEGTATVLAGVPGDPVHAKTGTAEFGRGSPPPTHAWITGFQGDIAFAVVVEGGGGGGSVAGPVAADFLRRLAAP